MTLSNCSTPSIHLCLPGIILALFSFLARLLYKISFTRELLPEPETPVTQVIIPRGIFTSIFFRLFSAAFRIVKNPAGFLRTEGTGICSFPLKYCPVMDLGFCMISSAVPMATSCPPCSPAPGPISTTQSAARMVSSSCSTTISVFPKSLKCFNVASSLSLSLWCRPILGSSRIYATPTRPEPIWVARRIL